MEKCVSELGLESIIIIKLGKYKINEITCRRYLRETNKILVRHIPKQSVIVTQLCSLCLCKCITKM